MFIRILSPFHHHPYFNDVICDSFVHHPYQKMWFSKIYVQFTSVWKQSVIKLLIYSHILMVYINCLQSLIPIDLTWLLLYARVAGLFFKIVNMAALMCKNGSTSYNIYVDLRAERTIISMKTSWNIFGRTILCWMVSWEVVNSAATKEERAEIGGVSLSGCNSPCLP